MEIVAYLENVRFRECLHGRYEVTFSMSDQKKAQELFQMKGEQLSAQIKKYKPKRSLTANAYFHLLVDKLATCIGISKPRCKNMMLGRYGYPYIVEGTEAVIKTNIPVEQMLENELVHCLPCGAKTEKGKEIVYYKIMRGSSSYDTKEMAALIDGVVSECKEQGIETLPQEEV